MLKFNNTSKLIAKGLLVVVSVLFTLGIKWHSDHKVEDLESKVERSLERYDSLIAFNEALKEDIQLIRASEDSLVQLIQFNKQTLQILNRTHNEKISLINNYDGGELLDFFSEFNTEN